MKKLSIEEKAKAYDDALKQIKECTPDENGFITIYPQEIFPGLKESEDEKIRKALIKYFKNCVSLEGINGEDISNWLEKQGETFTKKDVDDAYLKGICDAKHELEKQGEKGTNGNEREIPNSEQKPAEWSEEDEAMIDSVISDIRFMQINCHEANQFVYEREIDWLKCLKNRVQPQNLTVTDEELAQAKKDAYNEVLDKIEYDSENPTFDDGWSAAIWYMKKSLKAKEVDLEKEIELVKGDYEQVDVAWNNDFDFIARHFYELGLKAQKGE